MFLMLPSQALIYGNGISGRCPSLLP
jgi:hypothetical protein